MILALAATQLEMQPFLDEWPGQTPSCLTLITGVGPIETAVRLTRFLFEADRKVQTVVNFGIGGAYLQPDGYRQPELLDICLAEHEVIGDLGICLQDGVEYLDRSLTGEIVYRLDADLLKLGREILDSFAISCHTGVFITVNAATATSRRGNMLRERWQGLCENMEGAAIARVCREYTVSCLELRVVSNFVEDRNPDTWRLRAACLKAAKTAALIVKGMSA
jgi:futalosine hydrolase